MVVFVDFIFACLRRQYQTFLFHHANGTKMFEIDGEDKKKVFE